MDIQKINAFLAKHGTHTLSVERVGSGGVTVGKSPELKTGKNPNPNSIYLLDVPKTHITALYCCGEFCK